MDIKQEIRSFSPIDLNKYLEGGNLCGSTIDSIRAYNKAIENLRNGSEDIAMIELKSIVSKNPDFYEAVNLLGLCYAYTNQMDKAEELLGRVAEDENNGVKAADYLNYFNNFDQQKNSNKLKTNYRDKVQQKRPTKDVAVKSKADNNVSPEYLIFKNLGASIKKPGVAVVLNILSVILIVVSVILFINSYKNNVSAKNLDTNTPQSNVQSQGAANNSLVEENKKLKADLQAANNKLSMIKVDADITQAANLAAQKNYVQAADKLLAMASTNMTDDVLKRYNDLKSTVYPKAANQLSNEGGQLLSKKKYTDAIAKLEKVFVLGDKWTFGDKALYNLGKAYTENQQPDKAKEAFSKLVQDYPKSTYLKWAQARLKYL